MLSRNVHSSHSRNPRSCGISTLAWQHRIAWNCPIWHRKVMEKLTSHGFGKIFLFLSGELPFPERRILGGLFRAPFECKIGIFWAQNFYFAEFWFFSVEFAFFLSFEFLNSECGTLEALTLLPYWSRGRSQDTHITSGKITYYTVVPGKMDPSI